MLEHFLIPFFMMFVMEFGDKTQLLILSMSTKTKKKIKLLIGAAIGFLLADGLLVYFGDAISSFIPTTIVKAIAGVIFIGFGVYGYLQEEEEENTSAKYKSVSIFTSTIMVFLAEMGDKSQLGALVFGTTYNAHLTFIAIMLSLMTLTAITMFFGSLLIKYVKKEVVEHIANSAFIIIGMFTLLSIIL